VVSLTRRTPLSRGTKGLTTRSPLKRSSTPRKRQPISPASPAQREKVRDAACIVTGKDRFETRIDPAHLYPRGKGGCDSPLCVVPLSAEIHRFFDDGRFDLLPYLAGRYVAELAHALEHFDGALLSMLQRLTGERYVPERSAR
jgi:hypothetical protein